MAIIPSSDPEGVFLGAAFYYEQREDHYSFLKIENDTGFPMTFNFVYFDEDSCDFIRDYPETGLFPAGSELVESGYSAIYGVTGKRRASGLMGFMVQTGPDEWIAPVIYFLNPYNGSDQVLTDLIFSDGDRTYPGPSDMKSRFNFYYDKAGKGDITVAPAVWTGPLGIEASLSTQLHSMFSVRVYRRP